METRYARVVEEVAKLGSIRAASETIGYTQSAITKILHRIEQEFGERLFDRHPRGMRLNEYGVAFLEHSLAIDKEMRDAKSKIAALKSGETGRVVLDTAAWSTQILPGILASLLTTRPNLKIRVVENNAARLEQLLLEGRIDLAMSQPMDEQVVMESMGDVVFGLVTAVDHPLTKLPEIRIQDIVDYGWIMADGDQCTAAFLEREYIKHGLPWRSPDIEILPRNALLEIVAKTNLIAYLPLLNDPEFGPPVAKMACADLQWRIPAGMSFRKNRPVTAAGRFVFEQIKAQFQRSAADYQHLARY
ncbi:LysR family transcriptional regulator [Yoonia sp. BS5-3]|uniref:LysR family transcriptional regulator n=1 Tax=Yoonia phaeophyticola TaxID=3137369 RepID=A0ABZ2V3T3_9RHOB